MRSAGATQGGDQACLYPLTSEISSWGNDKLAGLLGVSLSTFDVYVDFQIASRTHKGLRSLLEYMLVDGWVNITHD